MSESIKLDILFNKDFIHFKKKKNHPVEAKHSWGLWALAGEMSSHVWLMQPVVLDPMPVAAFRHSLSSVFSGHSTHT